jgi:hypothetical protein
MSRSWMVVALGIIIALFAAIADPIGIGGEDSFGWKNGVVLVAGLALSFVGVLLDTREGRGSTG